jgi:hypothetical protein
VLICPTVWLRAAEKYPMIRIVNSLNNGERETQTERDRKDCKIEEAKRKLWGRSERRFISEGWERERAFYC